MITKQQAQHIKAMITGLQGYKDVFYAWGIGYDLEKRAAYEDMKQCEQELFQCVDSLIE